MQQTTNHRISNRGEKQKKNLVNRFIPSVFVLLIQFIILMKIYYTYKAAKCDIYTVLHLASLVLASLSSFKSTLCFRSCLSRHIPLVLHIHTICCCCCSSYLSDWCAVLHSIRISLLLLCISSRNSFALGSMVNFGFFCSLLVCSIFAIY